MQHHCTCKSYMIATISYREAPCPRFSIYQPAVKNVCGVEWNHNRFHCCISQDSLFQFIRFYAGKVKTIGISEELHCSLRVPINLFFGIAQNIPVEHKIRIQKPGWVGKCLIVYKCYHSLEWLSAHLWLGSSIVQTEETKEASGSPHPHCQHLKNKWKNEEH